MTWKHGYIAGLINGNASKTKEILTSLKEILLKGELHEKSWYLFFWALRNLPFRFSRFLPEGGSLLGEAFKIIDIRDGVIEHSKY